MKGTENNTKKRGRDREHKFGFSDRQSIAPARSWCVNNSLMRAEKTVDKVVNVHAFLVLIPRVPASLNPKERILAE